MSGVFFGKWALKHGMYKGQQRIQKLKTRGFGNFGPRDSGNWRMRIRFLKSRVALHISALQRDPS